MCAVIFYYTLHSKGGKKGGDTLFLIRVHIKCRKAFKKKRRHFPRTQR